MDIKLYSNKRYYTLNASEYVDIFKGYTSGGYEVDVSVLNRLSKDLGVPYDLYQTVFRINEDSASAMIEYLSLKNKHPKVVLLLDDEEMKVLDYSLDYERTPVLNADFIDKVQSLASTSSDVVVSEVYYHKSDKVASIILKKKQPITVEEKYENKASKFTDYDIGILLVNDETNSVYTRLVCYVEGQPLYLPASYYNSTSTRYKRSTSSSLEALEVLVLKIIDDIRDNDLVRKVQELHYKYRVNKDTLVTYEEYNSLVKSMRKIPTIIEDNSLLNEILVQYEDFENRYINIEDQKSSYIWRCTAIGAMTIGALLSITSKVLSDISAPANEYYSVRELLGSYLSTDRIVEEIAKESY